MSEAFHRMKTFIPVNLRKKESPSGSDDLFAWCLRFLLILALTGLIIRSHGCHPGGHEEDIDDELVYREYSDG